MEVTFNPYRVPKETERDSKLGTTDDQGSRVLCSPGKTKTLKMPAVAWTHTNKYESKLRRKDWERERKLALNELTTGKKEERH